MKNILLSIYIITLFWSCQNSKSEHPHTKPVFTNAVRPPALSEEEKQEYNLKIQEVLNASLFRTSFNGAILIAKEGDIVFEKYIGVKDPKTKDSLNAETSFQIASTGKTLTAAAVLLLAQEGRLSLNDEITKYFPSLPYPGITVKMLLNHRSGLPNYLHFMEKGGWKRTQPATNTDVLNAMIKWKPLKAANPDRRFNYSNTNYILLALIVEQVSGVSFSEYMKKNIFEPLGMSNSFVYSSTTSDKVLQSYKQNFAHWTLDFADGSYGDKNIYSSPRDLLKWDQALYDGSILNEQLLDSAFTPYSNEKPGVNNYGLGWRMLLYPSGKKVIYHNGYWHGFNSAFSRLTDENATIIIISNKYNPTVYSTAKKLYNVFGNYNGKQSETEE